MQQSEILQDIQNPFRIWFQTSRCVILFFFFLLSNGTRASVVYMSVVSVDEIFADDRVGDTNTCLEQKLCFVETA